MLKHAKTCHIIDIMHIMLQHWSTLLILHIVLVFELHDMTMTPNFGRTAQELHMLHLSVQEIVVLDGLVRCCQQHSATLQPNYSQIWSNPQRKTIEENRSMPAEIRAANSCLGSRSRISKLPNELGFAHLNTPLMEGNVPPGIQECGKRGQQD
jgi:hypothetical protein